MKLDYIKDALNQVQNPEAELEEGKMINGKWKPNQAPDTGSKPTMDPLLAKTRAARTGDQKEIKRLIAKNLQKEEIELEDTDDEA